VGGGLGCRTGGMGLESDSGDGDGDGVENWASVSTPLRLVLCGCGGELVSASVGRASWSGVLAGGRGLGSVSVFESCCSLGSGTGTFLLPSSGGVDRALGVTGGVGGRGGV
jgi:hypothetical protein